MLSNKSAWVMLCPLALFLMYDFIQMDFMNSLTPFLHHLMLVKTTQLGFISSMYFWINLLGLFFAGFLLDSFSPKWLIIISVAISLVGLVVFILYPSILTLIIWRSASGIAGSFSYLSVVKLLASHFPKNKIGLILGFSGFSIMLAGIIAQTPLILLLSFTGILNTLWIDLVIGLGVIICCYIWIPNQYSHTISALKIEKQQYFLPYYSIKNWILALLASLVNLPLFVLGALWGNLYLTHTHLVSTQQSSLIIAIMFVGNIVGAPIMGAISDYIGSRSKVILCGVILLIATISTINLLPITTSLLILSFLFFFLGFFITLQTPVYAAIIDLNRAQDTAKATSLVCFLSVLGGATSQPLFGWLVAQSTLPIKGYQRGLSILLIADIICLCLAIIYYWLARSKRLTT